MRDAVLRTEGNSSPTRVSTREICDEVAGRATPLGHMLTGQPGMEQSAQGACPRFSAAKTEAPTAASALAPCHWSARRQCDSVALTGGAVRPRMRATRIKTRPNPVIGFRVFGDGRIDDEDPVTIS